MLNEVAEAQGRKSLEQPDETADEVRAFARSAGWELSRTQLERRHRGGVIGRPRQVALGRGAGTVTLYPAGTKQRLIIALQLESQHRSLTQVAWNMWLDGHDVPVSEVRALLLQIAQLHDRAADWLKAHGFGQNPLSNFAVRAVAWLVRRFGSVDPLAGVGRRLGSRERTETVVRVICDMALGFYEEPHVEGDSDNEESLLARALGFDELETNLTAMRAAGVVQPEEDPVTLAELAEAFAGSWQLSLEHASDVDLRSARDRFLAMRDGMQLVSSDMQEIFRHRVWPAGRREALPRRPFPGAHRSTARAPGSAAFRRPRIARARPLHRCNRAVAH